MISINSIAVLIFASLIIQDEACTRALRRMNRMQGPSASQQGPLMPQQGSFAPQRGPSALQTPPTSQLSPATPTTISRPNAGDLPDDVNYNILSGPNPSRRRQDAITAENLSPLDFASTRDWIPDGPQDETKSAARPLSSILNSRRFNSASQPPRSRRDNPADSFYDMAASDETDAGNPETRSVTSALPDLLSSGLSGLSSLASKLPDASQVTPSLRDTTSSLSKLTPDVSGMTSSLSNIPNQVTSGLSSLSPTNMMPSSSGLSSIPGLMFLASTLASAFSGWNGENDTAASARSAAGAAGGSAPYNFLSYLPGIMSAATSLTPLLSNFGTSSPGSSQLNRSPLNNLANPLSYLPTSLFGGGNTRPDRYEMDEANRREKLRNRPKRGGNRYNGNAYESDYDNTMNDYSDERNDYNDGPQGYQYQYDYSPNGRGGGRTKAQSKRGDRNRFQYQYQYNQPQ